MADWGVNAEAPNQFATGLGFPGSLENEMLLCGTPASVATGVANQALYVPFVVQRRQSCGQFFWINGATVSGNVDVGFFDNQGDLIDHCGATAQAGTNVLQSASVLGGAAVAPGVYYLGINWTSATATFLAGTAPVAAFQGAAGMLSQAGTSGALPSTWTAIRSTLTIMPLFGLSITAFR